MKKAAVKSPKIRSRTRVIPFGNGWAVTLDVKKEILMVTLTQREAVKVASLYSKNRKGEVVVYNRDGHVKDTISYVVSPLVAPVKKKKTAVK